MARWLYSLFFLLLVPAILARMLWRSRNLAGYRQRWLERFGYFPAPQIPREQGDPLWIHAVSVGELNACNALIEALLSRGQKPLVVTTSTPTASTLVRQRYGERVFHVYLPFDVPWAIRGFLRRVRPRLLLLVEKELWPNLLFEVGNASCPIWVINGRMTAESARAYLRVRGMLSPGLDYLERILAQSDVDAVNWRRLVRDPARIEVLGNMKFDAPVGDIDADAEREFQRACDADGERLTVIAASTHPDEEELIIQAWTAVRASLNAPLLLVVAPRHPHRAPAIELALTRLGFHVQSRSRDELPGSDCEIFLLDTLGELPQLLSCARLVIVGGSFVPLGGHNLLEPARLGLPVVAGPNLDAQREAREALVSCGAMRVAGDQAGLEQLLTELLTQPELAIGMGEAGRRLVAERAGASQRLLELLGRVG